MRTVHINHLEVFECPDKASAFRVAQVLKESALKMRGDEIRKIQVMDGPASTEWEWIRSDNPKY